MALLTLQNLLYFSKFEHLKNTANLKMRNYSLQHCPCKVLNALWHFAIFGGEKGCSLLMNLMIYKPRHIKFIKKQWTKCKYRAREGEHAANWISDDEYLSSHVMKTQSYERCLQSQTKVY